MIDWPATQQQFGYGSERAITYRPKIIVSCDDCGAHSSRIVRRKSDIIDGQMKWRCQRCRQNDLNYKKQMSIALKQKYQDNPEYRDTISLTSKRMWQNDEVRNKISSYRASDATRHKISQAVKEKWNDIDFRQQASDRLRERWKQDNYRNQKLKDMEHVYASDEFRQKAREIAKERWQNPEYRKKIEDVWKDPKFKEKMARIRVNQQSKISSIQKTLYSILDDLGVKYYREYEKSETRETDPECQIGPHPFDCMIPRENKPDLLVECQGDYWHSIAKAISHDRAKATYIANNFSDQYELKCIWEHEFANKNKIIELLKYWLGITQLELIDFDFENVEIRDCPAKDYKLLLSKYHYLSSAGRGGMAHGSFGAYLADELIAVCVFSPLIRQNINIDGYEQSEVRELSRLCIHPRHQKKNFASWFVSRCIKQLDDKYKCIISYCDTTFNHDGATYKACNFIQDKEIRPDYWYVLDDGWVMHKKTLYNHARQLGFTEKEFAHKHGYKRVYGHKKLRFIYER